jgi:hypothetical protein
MNKSLIKNPLHVIPALYFSAIFIWMYFGNGHKNHVVLMLGIFFLLVLMPRIRQFSTFIGVLMLAWSAFMTYAFVSDLFNSVPAAVPLLFAMKGGLIIVLNLAMSILMIVSAKAGNEQ